MGKKIIVIALAMFAFGFGSTLQSKAGTEIVEPYRAPAPSYNYAPPPPPPRPIVYAPPLPIFGVVVGLRLLRARVRILRTRLLRCASILRAASLAFSSSLALTKTL